MQCARSQNGHLKREIIMKLLQKDDLAYFLIIQLMKMEYFEF
jgi:hypothetical protein